MNENKPTFAAFLDMEKAFDRINRDLLFLRLLEYGIDGKIYNSIKNLYDDNKSSILLNGVSTDWFNVTSGVRQGDTLSPILFSLFINELAIGIKNLNLGIDIGGKQLSILLYADDIVLMSDSEENLQQILNFSHEWCQKWMLKVNIEKSNVIHFRKTRKTCTSYEFKCGDCILKTVPQYTYLGITLDEHLTFANCMKSRTCAASRAFGKLISTCHKLKDVGYNTYCQLYDSLVVPVHDYASEIWGFKNTNICNKVHENAMRFYLGVHKLTPLPALYGEMGWIAVKYRHYLNIFRFWNRMMQLPNTSITKHVFQRDITLSTTNENNWSGNFKKLLICLMFYDANNWETRIFYLNEIKEKLLSLMETNWLNDMHNKPKLRRYITFKTKLVVSDHVKKYISKPRRSLLVQLLTGILPLNLETGRYKTLKDPVTKQIRSLRIEERLCTVCDLSETEDEIHFICTCTLYENHRQILFQNITESNPNFLQLTKVEKYLFLVHNSWKALAKFVEVAWSLRKLKLYIT